MSKAIASSVVYQSNALKTSSLRKLAKALQNRPCIVDNFS